MPMSDLMTVSIFLLLLSCEIALSKVQGKRLFSPYDSISNIASFIVYAFMFAILFDLVISPCYSFLFDLSLLRLPVRWWSFVVAVVAADFVLYWAHRLAHGPLWALHHPHHSSNEFNLTTGLRQSWLHTIPVMFYGLPFSIAGIPLELVISSTSFIFFYSIFVHTRYVEKLPSALEYILVTPSHHRVHHGTNEPYVDKNFGGLFILWDRLFGTFASEREEVSYGVRPTVQSHNLLVVQFLPLRDGFFRRKHG